MKTRFALVLVLVIGCLAAAGGCRTTQSAASTPGMIVLLLRFADRGEPMYFTKEYMDDLVFGPSNSLRDYVKENSYGKVALTGRTYGWFTMPGRYQDYSMPNPTVEGLFQYRFYNGQAVNAPRIILDDAIKLAEASGVDFFGVKTIILVVNGNLNSCGATFGTGGTLTDIPTSHGKISAQLVAATSSDMWNGNSTQSPRQILFHEYGHTLGLLHAASWACGAGIVGANLDDLNAGGCVLTEYGDHTDVMGSYNTGHFSAFNKEVIGYLSDNQIRTVSVKGEYSLDPFETPSDGYKALKIPVGSGYTYYLEYRTARGYDGGMPKGVYLRLALPKIAEPRWGSSAGVIDTLQPLDGTEPFLLKAGKPFSDPRRGVGIELAADDGVQARIRLTSAPGSVPAQPLEALALENKNPITVDTLLPIRKGQRDTMLLDFTVGTTGIPSPPVLLDGIRVTCHSITGLVFTAMRISRDGIQVGPTVTPVLRASTKDYVADFDLGASGLVIDSARALRLVVSGDVGTDFTVDYYSIVLIENVLGSRLETDGRRTPVRNAWNVFSGKLTVVP